VADTKAIAKNEGDILIYALYPTTGMRFLKWKYNLEPVPDEVKAKTLEQVALEDEVYLTIKAKKLFAKVKEYLDTLAQAAPEKGPGPGASTSSWTGSTTTSRWSAPPGPR